MLLLAAAHAVRRAARDEQRELSRNYLSVDQAEYVHPNAERIPAFPGARLSCVRFSWLVVGRGGALGA